MSIKNIIQQENDLQEMSQQSLANYLNNPTGQYNPYLVAGELQRKEQFAQRQMVEAPQETVVGELVQKTMPMGGMPMPQMPMPGPQETMVSDTITETGIASLPAPNIGQNYAEGGIIGYEEGGGVFEDEIELGEAVMEMAKDPSVVAEVGGTALMKGLGFANVAANVGGLGLAGLLYSDELGSAEDPNFAEKLEKYGTPVQNYAGGGTVRFGTKVIDYGAKKVEKIKDLYNKFTKKKAVTSPAPKTKTPPQTALEKANQFKKPSGGVGSGPLTQTAIKAVEKGLPALTRGAGKVLDYAVRDLPAVAGLGALGYGLAEYFGETEEEALIRERKAFYDSPAEKKKREDETKELQNAKNEQARADIAEKQRRAKNKRAYLALALGGAKTMAGKSPFALQNIGEGLGTGVASLVELDEAAAARQSAEGIADAKLRNDLYKESRDQMDTFNELKFELRGGLDEIFTKIFIGRLNDKGIDPADVTNPDYIVIENQTILDLYPGSAPTGSTIIDGQSFIGV